MKRLFGFIAQKIGLSCSSSNSRAFIDGWFLGSGITVKAWSWESRPYGKYDCKIAIVVHSRKDFKFGFSHTEYDCRIGRVFSFGYGAIVISSF